MLVFAVGVGQGTPLVRLDLMARRVVWLGVVICWCVSRCCVASMAVSIACRGLVAGFYGPSGNAGLLVVVTLAPLQLWGC